MDGWMDGCMDGWLHGWMDGWMDGEVDRVRGGEMARCMVQEMKRWIDG